MELARGLSAWWSGRPAVEHMVVSMDDYLAGRVDMGSAIANHQRVVVVDGENRPAMIINSQGSKRGPRLTVRIARRMIEFLEARYA